MDTPKRGRGRPKVERVEKTPIRPQRINPTTGNARVVTFRISKDDLAELDSFCRAEKAPSRSAGIRRALDLIKQLRK